MPYLLLILGLIIGFYALYRFFMNADVQQIKALFLMAIIVVLSAALFTLAVTGRLPAALAIMTAIAPLVLGWWRVHRDDEDNTVGAPDEANLKTRQDALDVLGLENDASEDDIKAAYKKLMQKVHPDHEGSQWMAAKLNQAREILLNDNPDT